MSMSVLIVEDDDLHRWFLYVALMDSDMGDVMVSQAANDEDASSLMHSGTFESVIVDLRMRGKTGVDVARAVWSKNKNTPIIFLVKLRR